MREVARYSGEKKRGTRRPKRGWEQRWLDGGGGSSCRSPAVTTVTAVTAVTAAEGPRNRAYILTHTGRSRMTLVVRVSRSVSFTLSVLSARCAFVLSFSSRCLCCSRRIVTREKQNQPRGVVSPRHPVTRVLFKTRVRVRTSIHAFETSKERKYAETRKLIDQR